jgi:hypothetical protein
MNTLNKTTNSFIVTISIISLITFGCGVTDTPPEVQKQESENLVEALVNGEPWKATYSYASFNVFEDDTLIFLSAHQEDSIKIPYAEIITFSYFQSFKDSTYSTIRRVSDYEQGIGVIYNEADGDANIGTYYPIQDSLDGLTLSISKDSAGNRFIEGAFETKVVVDPAYDRDIDQDRRRRPDTVRITNGYYRVELEKRSD